jgi:hypothetical protein
MASEAIVNSIIEVLAEDKAKEWSQQALAHYVFENKQHGVKADHQIVIAIRTLVAAGRVHGNMRGTYATHVKWKAAQDETAMEAVRQAAGQIKALKEQVISLKQAAPSDVVELQAKMADLSTKVQGYAGRELGHIAAMAELQKKYDAAKDSILAVRVTTRDASGEETTREVKDTFHKVFRRLLKLATLRKNILIYGPTGSGKTHICKQLAASLGLRFKYVSCTAGMSEGQLTGRFMPMGEHGKFEFLMSEFLDAFENGGVFLADEFDASDANVTLIINAALANGMMAVPNRMGAPYATRHPDFLFVAACNTLGTGASRTYSGRNKLDMSTLDRFNIGKVFMDYDPVVEARLCPDDVLRARLLRYRKAIDAHKFERAVSTRFMQDAYEMKTKAEDPAMRFTDAEIDEALFEGWREEEVNKCQEFRG